MSLNIAMPANADASSQKQGDAAIAGFINCVPNSPIIVSKPDIDCIVPKVMQLLELQGVACGKCPKCSYKLYLLSVGGEDEAEDILDKQYSRYRMEISCNSSAVTYAFEVSARPLDEGGFIHG